MMHPRTPRRRVWVTAMMVRQVLTSVRLAMA
jgi:hypothetical protein